MDLTGDAERTVDDLIAGGQRALILRAFVELGIADLVGPEGLEIRMLADAIDAPAASLSRFLRACSALGLCTEFHPTTVYLAPAGELLRRDHPDNAAGWASLLTAPWLVRAWEQLSDAVRSGTGVFVDVHGQSFWNFVAEHPVEAGLFDAAMTSSAAGRGADVADAVDLNSVSTVQPFAAWCRCRSSRRRCSAGLGAGGGRRPRELVQRRLLR